MIKNIYFENFKCFNKSDIPVKNVTVLAGQNGCGKSTVIQSLLLLKQSFDKFQNLDKLIISGELINLGNSSDIINEYTEESNIMIAITTCIEETLAINIPYEASKNLIAVETSLAPEIEVKEMNIFKDSFEYIAADRIIPQNIYSSINYSRNLGIHGEKVFSYLSIYGNEAVNEEIRIKDIPAGLIYQTNYWISCLFHGFSFQIQDLLKADSISLRYQEKGEGTSSNEYRPINVGFGITYILPVIVALLKAKPGDMVIVENPECHLHPKAQRQIGELISMVANTGVQVIVETHSDHILNGIRIAVKEKKIPANDTQILFFDREYVSKRFNTNIYAPNILEDGRLDYWPEGFFDEWDNALTELL